MPKRPAAAGGSARFGPELRLKRASDFARLRSGGKKVHAKHFLVVLRPNDTGLPRLGLVVTKKVEPRATGRNRIKRFVREVFRRNRFRLSDNFDIVVIARRDAPACSFEEVSLEILGALRQHGYLT